MAAILITTLLVLFRGSSAGSINSSYRAHGYCKQLDIPVFATSDSDVYNLPRVDNDLEATAWAIYADTWSTPQGPPAVIKTTKTSGTFNIHAQLCVPKSSDKNKGILQIATHGAHYDSRYWDAQLDREKHSYVEASLEAGYAILAYDRLGAGQSDKPDAYNVVQAPIEIEILRQLTLMARNGSLYDFAKEARPTVAAFKKLPKPSKVVHVGHSFGSVITSALIAEHGTLTDGAIITGYIENKYLGKPGMASFNVKFAGSAPYHRPSGYVVCQKSGIQNVFFGGSLKTAFTQEMLDYGDATKQPVAIGEIPSAYHTRGLDGSSFNAPVQYFLAEKDFFICGGDCNGIANMTALEAAYPNATAIEVAIQPNTGHAFPLHNNATAGYNVMFDFLARNGL